MPAVDSPRASKAPAPRTAVPTALLAIVLVGAALRLAVVHYGLPFIYHPDESFLITELGKALEGLSRGVPSIAMSAFYYPLGALYGIYFAVGRITGGFASVAAFRTAVLLDDPALHLIGRLLSVALSVGALVAVYALGSRLYGRRGGLMAAALMSVSLVDISTSPWLKLDAAIVVVSLISLLACLRLIDRPSPRSYLGAGVVIGIALALRIDLIVLLPVLGVAHLVASRPASVVEAVRAVFRPSLVGAVAVAAIVYLVATLQVVTIIYRHLVPAAQVFTTREVGASMAQFLAAGSMALSVRHNLPFYTIGVLIATSGVAVAAAIAIGIVRAVRTHTGPELVVLTFVAAAVAPMLVLDIYGSHYFLRIQPALMVLAAGGALAVATLVERRWRYAWVALLAVVAAQPAYYSVQYVSYLMTNTDTRTQAQEWLERHAPAGTAVGVQKFDELPRYAPPLDETPAQTRAKLELTRAGHRGSGLALEAQLAAPPPSHPYRIINLSMESYWNGRPDLENQYDLAALRRSGVRYVVTTGFSNPEESNDDGSPFGMVLAPGVMNDAALENYHRFMAALKQSAPLVAEFTSRDRAIARRTDAPIDPTIRIYQLGS